MSEILKNKKFMQFGLLYMVLLSLMVDLPEKNWSNSPNFKNGPLVRAGIIVLYAILLIIIYKDKDFVN